MSRLAWLTVLALLVCATSATAGVRPGPDALYAPAADAPQLQNAPPWTAPPILISGASAYRGGEFLYQDFLYDDHGAAGPPDLEDPFDPVDFGFSPKHGTLTYPTDPVFASNAADLVELRVKPLAGATAFRVTLNTLNDPERVGFTIALGGSPAPREWPHGAGVRSPAELFLTVHGTAAELRAADGAVRKPAPTVSVDPARRQFDVRVPLAAWDPGTSRVRMAAGVGLWDVAAGRYLAPRSGAATASVPGGAGPSGAALFNVAFRAGEPVPDISSPGVANTIAEGAIGVRLDGSWWRERAQGDALAAGDVSPFSAEVDFAKLARGDDDESAVPTTGHLNRILASRNEYAPGVDYAKACGSLTERPEPDACPGRFGGRLQPYAVYVPSRPRPPAGYGLTLLLHGLSANHNEFLGSRHAEQFGERGGGSIVASPLARGPDGFYIGAAELDVFEVWADVARHYPIDARWVAMSGYSMGGIGTFRLATRWPDLVARAFPIVGYPEESEPRLPSLRNVPVMTWAAGQDELVNVTFTEGGRAAMERAGLRYDHWLFNPAGHVTLGNNDEYGPAAEFLGEHRVDPDPPRVTYVVEPGEDSEKLGLVADHAYWLSALRVRDAAAGTGTIDARSHAFGVGDPEVKAEESSAGALEGGSHGPLPYLRRTRDWGEPPATPPADRLTIHATNLASATVDAARAKLSCAPQLEVHGDGPLELRIACPPPRRARRCSRTATIRLPRLRGERVTRVVVKHRGRRLRAKRGRDIRRIEVRRVSPRGFPVRIRMRTSRDRRVTIVRRVGACRRR